MQSMALAVSNFMKLIIIQKFCASRILTNFIQRDENGDNVVKTHTSLRTVPLSMPRFYETHNCSVVLCGNPLHTISPKTVKKDGKYEYKLTA